MANNITAPITLESISITAPITLGARGQDGDSAYEVAVENGYTGTVEEWLDSLVGPEGTGNNQTLQELLDKDNSATGTINVDIFSGYSGVFDSIQFNTGADTTMGQAQLAWNSEDLTLDLGLDTNVTLQVGQEQLIRVKCIDPSGVYDGMAVYAAGTVGQSDNIEIERFTASYTGVDELYFIGIATEDIAENAVGFVTTFGKVREVDGREFGTGQGIKDPANTGDWVLGDILWVSPNQAGTLTAIKPLAPNRRMAVAMVLSAPNQKNITLMVRAEHGYHLDEIHDIYYNSQEDRDLLLWNASDRVWENGTLTSADITGALGYTPLSSETDDVYTLTSLSGTVTPDAANGTSQKFPLTENVTNFNTPINLPDGQSMLIQILQDITPRTLALQDEAWVIMGSGIESDIGSLAAGQYAWLSISRYETDYLISITTQA